MFPKTSKIIRGSGKKLCKPNIKEESKDDMIKNVRKLSKLKKGDKVLKDKIIEIIKIFSN